MIFVYMLGLISVAFSVFAARTAIDAKIEAENAHDLAMSAYRVAEHVEREHELTLNSADDLFEEQQKRLDKLDELDRLHQFNLKTLQVEHV